MARGEANARLLPGREKSVLSGHPWLFAGAIGSVTGDPPPGAVVRVEDDRGGFLARGHYNDRSKIRVRILERREDVVPDETWFRSRIAEAVRRREPRPEDRDAPPTSCRLIFSEADLLPGLIVDRYQEYLAVQILTAGMETLRGVIVDELSRLLAPAGILERSDAEHRLLEGLAPAAGLLAGSSPPAPIRILDGLHTFGVDLVAGQKTGFYLDQRCNRRAVAAWSSGRRVLDAFCYTGAFSVHAAAGGAVSLLLIDSSAEALRGAEANLEENGLGAVPREVRCANAFAELRRLRDEGRTFDLAILDPPRLAPTKAHAEKAARAYKDANLFAIKLLSREGILATFSCSGGISTEHFREIVRWAAKDAGREVQILQILGAAPDHPIRLSFPESEYLKGVVCRVL